VKKNTIYFPKKYIFKEEWINNALVLSDKETMKCYCNLYPNIKELIKTIPLHSETLISEYLKKNNIIFETIDYDYELDHKRNL